MQQFLLAATPFSTGLGQSAKFILLLAIGMFTGSAIVAIIGKGQETRLKISKALFYAGSTGLFFAFGVLVHLFISHQFQFRYVANHSALDHEIQFLLAGVWSGQEGSFLLWAVASAIFGILTIGKTRQYQAWYTAIYAFFLAGLAAILSFESPFTLIPNGDQIINGTGMSPTLMNYWIVIHPPTIFLGFGSLTVLFAWGLAAILHRDLDSWIKMVRPWAILGLTLLGVGLCMGGFWAYETLGWGGFWMWDPVENTSFVPWLAVAAFIHGIFVQLARGKWKLGNALLAGLPFILFCYGTFLTRSGFLGDTSVHSFAKMDSNALWLLIGIGTLSLSALTGVGIWGSKNLKVQTDLKPRIKSKINRESFYTFGIWTLVFFGITTGIGMSVPFLQSVAKQQPKVVEEHLYHQVLAWPFPFIALAMAIAPFITWPGLTAKELLNKLINTLAVSIGIIGFMLLWVKWAGQEIPLGNLVIGIPGFPAEPTKTIHFFGNVNVNATTWVMILSWLCVFGIVASINRTFSFFKRSKTSIGGVLTHIGVFATVLGLIFSRGFEQKKQLFIHPTVPAEERTAFGYTIGLDGRTGQYTDRHNKIKLAVSNGITSFMATPGLYYLRGSDGLPTPIKSPFILSRPLYDLYFVAHEFSFDGTEPVKLAKGETARFHDTLVRYNGLRTEGELGTAGATFYADVTITNAEGEANFSPYFRMTDVPGQPETPKIPVSNDYTIRLHSIDAATKDASLVLDYRSEMFPVEVYYKPLTGFVWWGVGIMTLGGLLAAFSRRNVRLEDSGNTNSGESSENMETESKDAPEPVAKV